MVRDKPHCRQQFLASMLQPFNKELNLKHLFAASSCASSPVVLKCNVARWTNPREHCVEVSLGVRWVGRVRAEERKIKAVVRSCRHTLEVSFNLQESVGFSTCGVKIMSYVMCCKLLHLHNQIFLLKSWDWACSINIYKTSRADSHIAVMISIRLWCWADYSSLLTHASTVV